MRNLKNLLILFSVFALWIPCESQTVIEVNKDTLQLETVLCSSCFDEVESLREELELTKLIVTTQGTAIGVVKKELLSVRELNNLLFEKIKKAKQQERKIKRKSWINGVWQSFLGTAILILSLAQF